MHQKMDWDDRVPEDLLSKWKEIFDLERSIGYFGGRKGKPISILLNPF